MYWQVVRTRACRASAPSSSGRGSFGKRSANAVIVAMIARLFVLKFVIMRDPAARTYKDTALTPVGEDEEMTLNLLTNTTGAPAPVMHLKKIARLTAAPQVVLNAASMTSSTQSQRRRSYGRRPLYTKPPGGENIRQIRPSTRVFVLGFVLTVDWRESTSMPLGLDKVREDRFFAQCLAHLKPMQTVH
jgi:hypothetical protein